MMSWFNRCLVVGAMIGGLSSAYPGLALAQEAATSAREVTPERMMSLQERAALRERMRNATPQERQEIMTEKMGQLRQRAAENGAVMAENRGQRMRNGNGNGEMAAEANGGRSEMAPRAENGSGGKMMRRPPGTR